VHGRLCMAQATRLRRTHARSRESGYGSSVNACNGGGVDVLVGGRRAGAHTDDDSVRRHICRHFTNIRGGLNPVQGGRNLDALLPSAWWSATAIDDRQRRRAIGQVRRSGKFEGSISPQDFLVMRRPDGNRFDGRIDSQGTVKGRFTGVCSYLSVWQKAPESTTAFDGEYVGVSRESVRPASAQDAKCPPDGVSAPLTIWKGAVWSHGATWQGIVSQQGVLAMQNSKSTRLNGQIDAQGTIKGQTSGTDCLTTFVWRKQSN